MKSSNYLIVYKEDPLDVRGINSGAEMATLFLARYLTRLGHRVVLCAQLSVRGDDNDQGVEFWDLGPSYDLSIAFSRARDFENYHLISAGRAQPILESRNEAKCLSRVLITHDRSGMDTGIKPDVLLRVADQVICVSNAQREVYLKAGGEPNKVVVVHNGVDLELFPAGEVSARNFRKLAFVGALVQDKGPHVLLKSFMTLKQKYSDLTLDLYGSASLWRREKMFDEAQIEAQLPGVKFHGKQPQTVVSKAFREAGICVVPSIWFDPFPLTALEAQVSGCPVVAFDVGGLKEGFIPGRTGVLIEDISEQALTSSLDTLLGNPDQLREMSKQALATARVQFTWERVAKQVSEISERAAHDRPLRNGGETSSARSKIGVLSTWNQECGLATYGKYLFSQLKSDSVIVFGEQAPLVNGLTDESFVVRCWQRNSSDFTALINEVKTRGIQLLHLNCHDHKFIPSPQFIQAIGEIRSKGVKVISHMHTTFTSSIECRRFVEALDGVIVHTPENRLQVVANGGVAEKVWVLPHGVFSPQASESVRSAKRATLGLATNEKAIIAVGFIQPNKGMEAVVEAVHHLGAKGIPARGFILGKVNQDQPSSRDYARALRELVEKTGNSSRITIVDQFLSDEEMQQYFAASDLVIMNYQSQYYEASGATSLALGAGTVVMSSLSPVFSAFGEAVWHITSGFPTGPSAELLLTDTKLRETLKKNAAEYSQRNAWSQIAIKLKQIYLTLISASAQNIQKEKAVETKTKSSTSALRVLMQNRPNAYTQRGGDTVLMDRIVDGLRKRGIEVHIDLEAKEDPSRYDLVHLFNFALPDYLKVLAERAHKASVPFVVSTLLEDVASFYNQGNALAQGLVNYVRGGQNSQWWNQNKSQMAAAPSSGNFNNQWVAQNAAALFPNGTREAQTILRQNPTAKVSTVTLGCEVGVQANPELFVREYGVKDFVLCVGRLESRKNQLMLLKALEDSEIPVVLAAGGFSYQPDYEQAIRAFKRKGQTIVLPRVSAEMLASAYAAAKVHALPSWYELPGLVSLEAAAHGCNVVVTENGTAPDYFADKAFYCDPSNESSIANAIYAAFYGPKREGLKQLAQSFTWDKCVEQTIAAYEKIVGAKAQSVSKVASIDKISIPTSSWNLSNPIIPSVKSPQLPPLGATTLASTDTSVNNDVESLVEKGEEAARGRDLGTAMEYFAQAEKLSTTSLRLYRAKGAVLLAGSEVERAEESFAKALSIDSSDTRVLSGMGMCQMMKKNAEQAYGYFVKALNRDCSHLVSIMQLIECSYAIGRFTDLERVLRVYLQNNPKDVGMNYCLAGCLYKTGQYDESLQRVQAVLSSTPDHEPAKQLKGLIEEKQAASIKIEPKFSIESIKETTLEFPFDQSPSMNLQTKLAELEELKRQKNYSEVRQGCEDILVSAGLTDELREQTKLLKAEILVLDGELENAGKLYEEVLTRSPRSSRALCGKGALAAHDNRWDQAQAIFQDAHTLTPGYDVPLAGLGLCALKEKNSEKAWDFFQKALTCNPESIRALLGLIELGYSLGRLPQVEAALQAYLEYHPADLDFLYSLAGCFYAQGKVDEATQEISKITLFNPQHERALELKGMIDSGKSTGRAQAMA